MSDSVRTTAGKDQDRIISQCAMEVPRDGGGGSNPYTTILVVTPTYNSAEFLDDTILSVVSQSGAFHLRYHIQDGGSSDATMAIIRRWDRLLLTGDFPILCAGLTFSFDSRPDAGMYQAINGGVAHARPDQPFVMGWINSDDRLAPGALAAIADIYEQFADVHFTCARVSLIDRHGVITGIELPTSYDRRMLSEGAHDGRSQKFVMQEGTFWRSALWDRVGGLDERFRLAGDWDLWRRFARHAALFTVDTILGFHRRHAGQLSNDMDRYHAEIDAADRLPGIANSLGEAGGIGATLRFDLNGKRWERSKRHGTSAGPPIVQHEREGVLATHQVEVTHGARNSEGPYPEAYLPAGMRWIDDARATASVTVPFPGRWHMHLRIRNWRPDLRLRVLHGTAVALDSMPGAGEDSRDTLLLASLWLEGGHNELRLESAARLSAAPGWMFILLEWYVLAPVERAEQPLALAGRDENATEPSAPLVSVILRASAGGRPLDQMIDAVLAQGHPEVEICVVHDALCEVNRHILEAYAPVLDHVIAREGADLGVALGRAVALCHGALIAVLNDDAMLSAGALAALAAAYRQRDGATFFVGITAEEESLVTNRHLPTLPDGPLSVPDLLRIGARQGASNVFDRGALFFTRDLWLAVGNELSLAATGCAFGFWGQCAAVGGSLQTLPVDLIRRVVDRRRNTAQNAADDLLQQTVALADDHRLPPVRAMVVRTRSALKIVLLDAEPVADRPSPGCNRLAAALAAAGQRVVCLVGEDDAEPATVVSVLEAIAFQRPDLVVIVGDSTGGSGGEVASQLVAKGVPTLNVGECRPSSGAREASRLSGLDAAIAPDRVMVYQAAHAVGDPQSVECGLRPGVDLALYRPNRRRQARLVLSLPLDAFIVLAVANTADATPHRLATLVEAHARLDCCSKLLIVLGGGGAMPASDAGAEDIHALYFAAADVVVSLAPGNVILPLVQSAACGTPAIADGGGYGECAIARGPFGLRLPNWTSEMLREALERLRSDRALRRQIARSAVACTRAQHSLEASAWSFMTQVTTLRGFECLRLGPELSFPSTPRFVALHGLRSGRVRPRMVPRWQPAATASPWHDAATVARGTEIDLAASAATFYLRAAHGGPQPLHIRASGRGCAAVVVVRINGKDHGPLRFAPRDDGYDAHILQVSLFAGLNRVEFALAAGADAASTCMTLRSLDLGDEAEDVGEESFRRRWQPLIGFAEVEQIDGNDAPTRWIDEASAALRFWSDVSAPQRMCLFLKNYGEPRAVDLGLNGTEIGTMDAPTTNFRTLTRFVAEVAVERGWNLVSLNAHGAADAPALRRNLLMVVVNVYVTPIGDTTYQNGYEYRTSAGPQP